MPMMPELIGFYGHYGGVTIDASEAWWSTTTNHTYPGAQTGMFVDYSSFTHLHIWVAANGHAMYNRYDSMYWVSLGGSTTPAYIDNIDSDPSNYDLYFSYDLIENLGEVLERYWDVLGRGAIIMGSPHGFFTLLQAQPEKTGYRLEGESVQTILMVRQDLE